MKKRFMLFVVCLLLLTGCGKLQETEQEEEKQEEEERVISDPPPTWEERKECALWQMPVIEEIQPGRKHAVRDRLSMQRKLVNRF